MSQRHDPERALEQIAGELLPQALLVLRGPERNAQQVVDAPEEQFQAKTTKSRSCS